ncbi:MAG: hypothetical protein Unbinned6437contig1000_77 [Prokaryotic dsDNA virus sp.]|nr:MAG: hypothetical protein Unbinned6437contig1000_77 [Prokaryotic dsDNA virus sp.]|tara:strand:- start:3444 stop:3632 length:189 start_codon:yes stop_codon:yes gene_type:complete
MAAVKLIANRDAIRLILDSLGLNDECITSLSINGKEIINLENLNENIEITVSRLIVNKGAGG